MGQYLLVTPSNFRCPIVQWIGPTLCGALAVVCCCYVDYVHGIQVNSSILRGVLCIDNSDETSLVVSFLESKLVIQIEIIANPFKAFDSSSSCDKFIWVGVLIFCLCIFPS